MSMDLVELSLFFSPPFPVEKTLGSIRRVLSAVHERETFHYWSTQSHLEKAERDDNVEKSIVGVSLERSLKGTPQNLSVYGFREGPWAQLKMMLSVVPFERAGVEDAWNVMLATAPRAIEATDPMFALLNGVGGVGSIYKNPVKPGELPSQWTPWMYLAP